MLRMKRLKATLTEALEVWSDFTVLCWMFAARFAASLALIFLLALLVEGAPVLRALAVPVTWFWLVTICLGLGTIMALLFVVDRMLVARRSKATFPKNGGRPPKLSKPAKRQWGNRKRKTKA